LDILIKSSNIFAIIIDITFGGDMQIKQRNLFIISITGLFAFNIATIWDIPYLRQILGFIVLSFFPGLIILHCLRIDSISKCKAVVYSLGLSLFSVMGIGLITNMILPIFGYKHPFSLPILLPILNVFLFLLVIISFIRNIEEEFAPKPFCREGMPPSRSLPPVAISERKSLHPSCSGYSLDGRNLGDACSDQGVRKVHRSFGDVLGYNREYTIRGSLGSSKIPMILSILIILTSILGPYFVNTYQSNTLQIVFVFTVIFSIAILVLCRERIDQNFFPVVILSISSGLVMHSTLLSSYLRGADVHLEYNLFTSIINKGYWQMDVNFHNLTSVLSITTLAPVYSTILNVDGIVLFKVIYPLLFSFVPLILYLAYEEYIGKLPALLSSFIFSSFPIFYTELTALARQEIAEIFFALLILVLLEKRLSRPLKHLLYIVFCIGLIFSHYGLAYIYMVMIGLTLIFSYIINQILKSRNFPGGTDNVSNNTINIYTSLIYVICCTLWYTSVSNSGTFRGIISIGYDIKEVILEEFFTLSSDNEYVSMALGSAHHVSNNYLIATVLFDVMQLFIVIGVIKTILSIIIENKSLFKSKIEYVAFAMSSLLLLAISVAVPAFSNQLNLTRMYHIFFFALCPFVIIGGLHVADIIHKNIFKQNENNKTIYLIASFTLGLFIFQSGIVFELTNDKPLCYTVSPDNFLFEFLYDQDFSAFIWLESAQVDDKKTYGDFGFISYYFPELDRYYHYHSIREYLSNESQTKGEPNLLYVRKGNTISQKMCLDNYKYNPIGITDVYYKHPLSTIYSSGPSKLYQTSTVE